MGESFIVGYTKLNTRADELEKIWIDLVDAAGDVEALCKTRNTSPQLVGVMQVLGGTVTNMNLQANQIKKLTEGLRNISTLYMKTEKALVNGTNIESLLSATDGAHVEEGLPWWKTWGAELLEKWDEFSDNPINKNMLYSFSLVIPGMPIGLFIADTIYEDNYWGRTVRQVILGDFTDDCTLLGTLLSIGIGYIPYVGPVIDFVGDSRDLVANVISLIDDGAEPEEVVMTLFSAAGFIPAAGEFLDNECTEQLIKKGIKYLSDSEVGEQLLKRGDEILTEFEEIVENTKIVDALDWGRAILEDFEQEHIKPIKKYLVEQIDKLPGKGIRKLVEDIWDININKINIDGRAKPETVGEFVTENFIKDPIEDKVKEWISERSSDVWDYMKEEYKERQERTQWSYLMI